MKATEDNVKEAIQEVINTTFTTKFFQKKRISNIDKLNDAVDKLDNELDALKEPNQKPNH